MIGSEKIMRVDLSCYFHFGIGHMLSVEQALPQKVIQWLLRLLWDIKA